MLSIRTLIRTFKKNRTLEFDDEHEMELSRHALALDRRLRHHVTLLSMENQPMKYFRMLAVDSESSVVVVLLPVIHSRHLTYEKKNKIYIELSAILFFCISNKLEVVLIRNPVPMLIHSFQSCFGQLRNF